MLTVSRHIIEYAFLSECHDCWHALATGCKGVFQRSENTKKIRTQKAKILLRTCNLAVRWKESAPLLWNSLSLHLAPSICVLDNYIEWLFAVGGAEVHQVIIDAVKTPWHIVCKAYHLERVFRNTTVIVVKSSWEVTDPGICGGEILQQSRENMTSLCLLLYIKALLLVTAREQQLRLVVGHPLYPPQQDNI